MKYEDVQRQFAAENYMLSDTWYDYQPEVDAPLSSGTYARAPAPAAMPT